MLEVAGNTEPPQMTQSTKWCFTSYCEKLSIKNEYCKYYVYQQERGKKEGKLHWQGFIWLLRSQRLNKVKDIIGDEKCHVEQAKGNIEQNRSYCTKRDTGIPDTIVEYGECKLDQGKRSDLEEFVDFIKNHKEREIKWTDINEKFTSIMARYPKYVKECIRNYKKRLIKDEEIRSEMTKLHIISDKTGTGKTTFLKELKDTYWKNEDDIWWDGYEGQKVCIFNEWTGTGKLSEIDLFKLSDHAPYRIQIKGDSVQFTSEVIWVSTNKSPKSILNSVPMCNREAFARRIKWYKMENWKAVEVVIRDD